MTKTIGRDARHPINVLDFDGSGSTLTVALIRRQLCLDDLRALTRTGGAA